MRFMNWLIVASFTVIAWGLLAGASSAAVIEVKYDDRGPYINYVGTVEHDTCEKWTKDYKSCLEVVPRDSFRLLKLAQSYPEIRRIKMSSGGGVASQGYELGRILRIYEFSAEVPKGAYCLSACAIAFSGAVRHTIEGVLGYHATWTSARNLLPIQAMAGGQRVATDRAKYLLLMGYHYDLALMIAHATSPSVFLVFRNDEDFQRFFVGPEAGTWGSLVNKDYEEEFFEDRFWESKIIMEYAVAQRLEVLSDEN